VQSGRWYLYSGGFKAYVLQMCPFFLRGQMVVITVGMFAINPHIWSVWCRVPVEVLSRVGWHLGV
jgi:hypothetical protein